jgi:hypothetical protein
MLKNASYCHSVRALLCEANATIKSLLGIKVTDNVNNDDDGYITTNLKGKKIF